MASTQRWPLRSYLELGALPTAVPCARLHTRNVLHEWRLGALADTTKLVVSEILTNAVRTSAALACENLKTGREIGLPVVLFWLTSDGHHILIQVWDGDHRKPAPRDADLAAENGRGLLLVETLSAQWGCHAPQGQNGKIVWAVVTESPRE